MDDRWLIYAVTEVVIKQGWIMADDSSEQNFNLRTTKGDWSDAEVVTYYKKSRTFGWLMVQKGNAEWLNMP